MKYVCTVISVADISAARKFYEELFGLEVYQDYGKNIAFTCGLALQQDFDWLVSIPKEKVLKKSNNAEIVFEEQDFDGFLNRLPALLAIYKDRGYDFRQVFMMLPFRLFPKNKKEKLKSFFLLSITPKCTIH